MKLDSWRKTGGGYMLNISREEAMKIAVSLNTQMLQNSPNAGRAEFTLEDGKYFSISVNPEPEPRIDYPSGHKFWREYLKDLSGKSAKKRRK